MALIIKRKVLPATGPKNGYADPKNGYADPTDGSADPKDGYADPLVADAIKAQPVLSDIEKSLAAWERFPAPDARRQPCRFCGDNLIQRCKGEEHVRCLNFHTAELRKQGRG